MWPVLLGADQKSRAQGFRKRRKQENYQKDQLTCKKEHPRPAQIPCIEARNRSHQGCSHLACFRSPRFSLGRTFARKFTQTGLTDNVHSHRNTFKIKPCWVLKKHLLLWAERLAYISRLASPSLGVSVQSSVLPPTRCSRLRRSTIILLFLTTIHHSRPDSAFIVQLSITLLISHASIYQHSIRQVHWLQVFTALSTSHFTPLNHYT